VPSLKRAYGMEEHIPEQPPEHVAENTRGTADSAREELRELKRPLLLEQLAKRNSPSQMAKPAEESDEKGDGD
jgi:hypothetical protein